jgi:hypothetical protein
MEQVRAEQTVESFTPKAEYPLHVAAHKKQVNERPAARLVAHVVDA